MTVWKTNEGRRFTVMPKWAVPQLLHRLDAAMEGKWDSLAKAGFRACGIFPFNPRKVQDMHFRMEVGTENISQNLIDYLETRRAASVAESTGRSRRRRLQVPAGQAVSVADLERMEAEAAATPRARGRGHPRGRPRGSGRGGRGRGDGPSSGQ